MTAPQRRQRPGRTGRDSRNTLEPCHSSRLAAKPSSRPLPPFGREVEAALAADKCPNVYLFACRDAWDRATAHRLGHGPGSTLILPPGSDPEGYRWPRVRDLVADVTGLPGDTARRLANALVRDGVRLAYLLDRGDSARNLRVIAKRPWSVP